MLKTCTIYDLLHFGFRSMNKLYIKYIPTCPHGAILAFDSLLLASATLHAVGPSWSLPFEKYLDL